MRRALKLYCLSSGGLTAALTLSMALAGPASAATPSTYRVVPGDTLSSVAARFDRSVAQFAVANRIANPNLIEAGQVLVIPDQASGASSSAGVAPERQAVSTAHTTTAPSGGRWSCIVAHESGGNPHAVNRSSGAGGLYQIIPGTWHAYGGTGSAASASVAEQQAVANRIVASSGYSAWASDGC